jgi:TetR/AcrR family transcriptional regulator
MPLARGPEAVLGRRALATRDLVLETAHELFLKLGYRGTRVDDITAAAGISRAGFYTYFADKQEVFLALGTTTYREITKAVATLGRLPHPCTHEELRGWVVRYFEFMDAHGAFLLTSERAGPDDPNLVETIHRLQMRHGRRLGKIVNNRRGVAGDDTAVGLALMGLLDQAWFVCHGLDLPIGIDRIIDATTDLIASYLGQGVS